MTWVKVFNSTKEIEVELIENRVGKKLIGDKYLCFAYHEKQLFAFEESCPHLNQSLLGGSCDDGNVICPVHQYKFNLQSGQGHGLSLLKYPIKKEGDQYFIKLK